MAETYAFRKGLALAQQFGFQNFTVQTDCVQVVDTMMQRGFSSTSAAAIYDDCYVLWSSFNAASGEYCNREANEVAHELARNAFTSKSSCIWVDELPSLVLFSILL